MAPSLDRQGYWGRPTSTLDWCEENYVVSVYIAEFCKSVIIAAFIFGKNMNLWFVFVDFFWSGEEEGEDSHTVNHVTLPE